MLAGFIKNNSPLPKKGFSCLPQGILEVQLLT